MKLKIASNCIQRLLLDRAVVVQLVFTGIRPWIYRRQTLCRLAMQNLLHGIIDSDFDAPGGEDCVIEN